jgi:hypothetical protein
MFRSFRHGCRLNYLVEGLLDEKVQRLVIQFPRFSVEGKFENFVEKNFVEKDSYPANVLVIDLFKTAGLRVLTVLPADVLSQKNIFDVNCTQAGRKILKSKLCRERREIE